MSIKHRKIISFILAFVLSFALITPMEVVFAAEENVVQILHLNDVHGRLSEDDYNSEIGYPKLKTRIDELKAENPNTLLLNAGDTVHGTTTVNLTNGKTMIDLMNIMGFDAMVPGNHDFNYGYERLIELKEMAEFPIIAANIKKEADNSTDFEPYQIFTMENGLKVGVFGIATDETKYKSHPDNTKGIKFTDAVVESKKAVQKLKDEEDVDLIVALSHLGTYQDSNFTSVKIAENIPDIDVIIDGHSHTKFPEGKVVNGVLIAQAEAHTKNLGVVKITLEDNIVKSKTARLEGYESFKDVVGDQEILDAIKVIEDENKDILEEVIGKTNVNLDGERENVRTSETNLGNLITDAMRIVTSADIAITNGGGIRASIPKGDITFGHVVESFPFTNTIAVIEVTGQEVKEALEHGVDVYPEPAGHFAHVSGVSYKFDPSQPIGERVFEIMMDNEPLDMDKTYKVVTNDFMASGGDNYTMFEGKSFIAEGGLLSDALTEYIRAEGDIDITKEDRIVVGEKPDTNLVRLAGNTRIETAIAASKRAYKDGAKTVVLAGYNGEVDALTGTLLANDKEAPLLLTAKNSMTDQLKDELKRLSPDKVYILGGSQVVSKTIENELKEDYTVERIDGLRRENTAVNIAKEVKKDSDHIFLARGYEELADALTIGPVSAMKNDPVLLTQKDKLPQVTIDALKDMKVKQVTIVGGNAAVSLSIERQLRNMKLKVSRVAGDRREDTALEIAGTYFTDPETALLAYGWKEADALVGGYLGAKWNAPILLTNKNSISYDTLSYMKDEVEMAYILGGEKAVSNLVARRIANVLN